MSIPGRGTISYGDCVCHLNPNESGFKDVMRLEYEGVHVKSKVARKKEG